MKKALKSNDQLFKRSLASVFKTAFWATFTLPNSFIDLNTIYREQFHDNTRRKLVKYLSS